jgi:prevent-host-death family protein
MDPLSYSIADARNALPRLVRDVERGRSIALTRRGKRVAVVLSEVEYRRLLSRGSAFREAFEAFMAERPDGGWLTETQVQRLRDRRTGRRVKL